MNSTSQSLSSVEPSVVHIEPVVRVEGLSLAFQPDMQILSNVSLGIRPGEFVSLVGPSGCGKTTLLNMMAGLVQVEHAGHLEIMGQRPKLGSSRIAYMLARDSLLPWRTALENAAFGTQVRGVCDTERLTRARELLHRVGLTGFEDHYPKALSHGMRQRVALARTFCLDSPLLLMDEPFGALDAQTKLQLEELLAELWQQERRTVVFVTHDLSEAVALSDRVIIMSARPGRMVADVKITLPRPRSIRALQKDRAFHELYAQVWTYLEAGWSGNHER